MDMVGGLSPLKKKGWGAQRNKTMLLLLGQILTKKPSWGLGLHHVRPHFSYH